METIEGKNAETCFKFSGWRIQCRSALFHEQPWQMTLSVVPNGNFANYQRAYWISLSILTASAFTLYFSLL